ncbi:MAG TPA: UdgX family uracil-DNA binding protein [Pedomonas sp.]|uniref:UdgX family uracil-DNA binding protein n=1 Tax=Pedomonas sp. TaxID=2976421 RepID=UPI002F3FAAA2
MIRIDLPRFERFEAWRQAARHLAGARVPSSQVIWADHDAAPDLFGAEPLPPPGNAPVSATRDFLDLARTVSFHSSPERWTLLYEALTRLQRERRFLKNPADPFVARLETLAKAVRRDIHKMHAFVRFHEVPSEGPRRAFAAWFEPEHLILEAAAPFFAKRFSDMDWLIATPDGVAHFDGALQFSDPVARPELPTDASHELWQIYFANIFNPARIKVQAMRSEMPIKYWKNLPEARLIPDMLADAPRRVRAMNEAGASNAPAYAAKVTARIRVPRQIAEPRSLPEARDQAAACTACDLCHDATQTVWGHGPVDAVLMIVGEAPGDQEDLKGRPLIGPAGQLLRTAMAEVGLDPEAAWLTNAVKHFKFTVRGKHRLHQNPTAGEIQTCQWWLDLERRFIQPRLTLALGASAAYSLTGNPSPLRGRRGKIEYARDGGPVLITWHPSMILRQKGQGAAARRELLEDLAHARAIILA